MGAARDVRRRSSVNVSCTVSALGNHRHDSVAAQWHLADAETPENTDPGLSPMTDSAVGLRGTMHLRRWWGAAKRCVRQWEDDQQRVALQTHLAQRPTAHDYSADYVSPQTEVWSRLFRGLEGAPGIRILEVGSYEGRSAVWFLNNVLTHPSSELVCVDLFSGPTVELRFDHNIRVSGAGQKVAKLKGWSGDILSDLPSSSFDVVYIDGSHAAADVMLDAMQGWRLLKAGGILLFDDYLWEPRLPAFKRPQMAIDLFLDMARERLEIVHKDYQVAVRKS
jgi:predicted O-methyltransferase YrrM